MAQSEPKFAAAFAAGSAVAGAGASVFPVLAWPALSFAIVGLAYAGLGARLLAKDALGKRHPLVTAVLAPYLAIAWAILLVLRLRDEDGYHEVRARLYVGRRPLRASELPSEVSLIVDLTSEFPGFRPKGIEYVCLPTLDGAAPYDLAAVRALVERIRLHEGSVYVHCAAGHGRSVAIVASVLVAEGRASSMEEAVTMIRRVRPGAGLSRSQRALVRAVAAG